MKERLVGAAILVGLIVVLVPEMLSGPKEAVIGTAQTGDGSMQTYTIDLSAPERAARHKPSTETKTTEQQTPAEFQFVEPARPQAEVQQAEVQQTESAREVEPPPPPAQIESDSPPKPETRSESDATSGRQAPPKAASKDEPKPAPKPATTPPKPEPKVDRATVKPASTGATKPAGAWAVQLGSFSSQDNAKRLTTELKAKGYKAFVSPQGSGPKTRYRVRVGPEASRAMADKLAQRLKRDGRQVTVVAFP